ncbi:hypothetical protein B0H16DRAFT_1745838 [Mycena metata]|uniref:Uncharacterized protein n=1 Tax=Mycena metata TaxID=1033252 RepID=A0AAD7MBK0_9AGAR|nr:hypothetical protein B0H16DRAFT_1745838 [Mycena metata]
MAVEIVDTYSIISSAVMAVVAAHCAQLRLGIFDTNSLLTVYGPMPRLRALDFAFISDKSGVSTFPEAPLLRTVRLDCYFGSKLGATHFLDFALRFTRGLCPDFTAGVELDPLRARIPLRPRQRAHAARHNSPIFTVAGDPTPDYLSLGHLIAPTLCHLDITEDFLGVNPVDSLVLFISNAGCTLKDVCIGGCTLWRHTYRKAFPSIKFTFSEDPSDGENDNSTAGSAASSNCDGETT